MIYFIEDRKSHAVKIGFSNDPKRRRGLLQVGNPNRLRLIGTIPGTSFDEAQIHKKVWAHRIRGEWFRFNSHVSLVIHELIREHTSKKGGLYDSRKWTYKLLDEEFQKLVNEALSEIPFPCLIYRIMKFWNIKTGEQDFNFQVMPDHGHTYKNEFWYWVADHGAQFFETPGHACDDFVNQYRLWKSLTLRERSKLPPSAPAEFVFEYCSSPKKRKP